MLSLKGCIASLAFVAFALAPVAQATPVKVDTSILVRRTSQPSFYSNEAALDKRSSESRKDAAARIRRAKLRAAKKAKRAHAEALSQELVKRAVSSIEESEGLTKRDIERRALFARALRRVRCGQSMHFKHPDVRHQLCDSSNGYTATSSGTCVSTTNDPDNCGSVGNVCAASYNGIGTRSCVASTCRITCPAGYSLRKAQSSTNPYYCYNGSSSLVSS
ncbi:SPOSA6832_00824 [Sporobolomyces salmonicolor]|uniref:SPOSA6832_00824-mRNA-1:cds n=1 Tax=Sporidiobolus salmonicolor TaxID=5005 RepID=A0A0D6EH86_SPOSA|nr:SPOSA6832_00824 [Sporobolomyces salmonicolor]